MFGLSAIQDRINGREVVLILFPYFARIWRSTQLLEPPSTVPWNADGQRRDWVVVRTPMTRYGWCRSRCGATSSRSMSVHSDLDSKDLPARYLWGPT